MLLIDISNVITDTPSKRAFGLVEEESTIERVESELKRADDDRRIKAIVLRINSPGGGVTASDVLYSDLVRFKRKHDVPVVAALGDLAASGGYYVACAADRIVAHPTTVTGSIGVILMNLNLEGLLAKVGVRNETFKAGVHKDLLSPFRGATPEERRIVQTILDSLHARFVSVVRENRPRLDEARVAELTDGRIFDASQALGAGLVDEIGDLPAAIAAAEEAAGVTEARVVMYHRSDETRENIYSAAFGLPAQVNILPLDLGALAGGGARFMYLWAPGLGE
ncbi:MAG: signal peptide peptidase SppA [Deltaproteobacteria bacterium]|nr:MAG: signal peptide peptidase SppA [Deltaproteobacteria bacterium]